MLSTLFKLFILSSVSSSIGKDDNLILIKLQPKEVIDTIKSLISVEYLEKLSTEFAKKAAQHFMQEIKNEDGKHSKGSRYNRG